MGKTAIVHWLEEVTERCHNITIGRVPGSPTTLSHMRARWFCGAVTETMQNFLNATKRESASDAANILLDLICFSLGRLCEMGVPEGIPRRAANPLSGGKEHNGNIMKPDGEASSDHDWLSHLSPVAIEAAKLRAKKRADYSGDSSVGLKDYFPFAELSYAQMIWTKALRIRSLAKQIYDARVQGQEHQPKNESLRDSLIDLHNYVDFAVEDIDGTVEVD
jgi:hypothetical protein